MTRDYTQEFLESLQFSEKPSSQLIEERVNCCYILIQENPDLVNELTSAQLLAAYATFLNNNKQVAHTLYTIVENSARNNLDEMIRLFVLTQTLKNVLKKD